MQESQVVRDMFMPHGMCYLWRPGLLWMHVTADLLTGVAYWLIPPFLLLLVLRARASFPGDPEGGLPFHRVFIMFGIFIVACGATHFMSVWTVWQPVYWLSGSMKVLTAAASVATAVALPPLIPKALDLLRNARASERRRQELEAAHVELEATNAELARLYEQLRAADRVKTDFFANVSHELRTPVALILGPVEQLLSEASATARDRERLRSVQRNAQSLLGYVDNLLEVAHLDARRPEPSYAHVDLPGLVRRVAARFHEYAMQHGITFVVETPDLLGAQLDPAKVERILANLVSNAFKFTPDGGRIRSTVSLTDGETVVIEVADSGPGIRPELWSTIFERFQQGDEVAARFGGSGLGLAIAREFALLHGGSIEVGDAPEGGALFTVTMPQLAPPDVKVRDADVSADRAVLEVAALSRPVQPVRSVPASSQDNGRAKVLVVEDNVELAAWISDVLSAEHVVETAHNGEEGLRRALEWKPDLIVTDLMMPRLSGELMIEQLRELPSLADTPVVVLSARPDIELRARLLENGAMDYVEKPVRGAELRARIRNLVTLTRSRAILQRDLESTDQDLHKLAEEAATRRRLLERTLAEKQVILQELHHRVKGNLQTISSLLSLQLRGLGDPAAREALTETRGRVAALAMLHEMLYRTSDAASVHMLDYIRSLVRQILRTQSTAGDRIQTSIEGDDVVLDADKAIACGMIVHELVSNALKHGIPDDRAGRITVTLQKVDGDAACLRVADNGLGIPATLQETGSVGLDLVRSFARQLGARLEVEPAEPGTCVSITFPTPLRLAEASG
jgi:signal transduction histidine kinase